MAEPQNKPDLPELQELAPLIDAGDWDAVDALLDADYAAMLERKKVYKGVNENKNREDALGNALIEAVNAWRPQTVERVLRLGDFPITDLFHARQSAVTQERYDVLQVLDRFTETIPEVIRGPFTDAFAKQKSPQGDPKLKAARLNKLRRKQKRPTP